MAFITSDGKIKLSPSALSVFLECKRCFWLTHNKKLPRPRGIFPSLPSGMDLVIKDYFDKYRNMGKLPPELKGKVDFKLFPDLELLNQWRSWKTGLEYVDEEASAILFGALDDLGVAESGGGKLFGDAKYVPLDYKTKGYEVKEGDERFYQNQLDSYGLMLRGNKMPPTDYAYLIYYVPKEVSEGGMVKFDVTPKKVKINPDSALKVLRDAVAFLKEPEPKLHTDCEYCVWSSRFIHE